MFVTHEGAGDRRSYQIMVICNFSFCNQIVAKIHMFVTHVRHTRGGVEQKKLAENGDM